MVIGAFTEIPSAGASTSVFMGGLALTVAAGGVLAKAATDFDSSLDSYVKEMQSIAKLQSEISIFSGVVQQLSHLDDTAQSGGNAAQDLNLQWGSVKTNYETLVNDLSNQSANLMLAVRMNTALNQWRAAADNARSFQANLSMVVENRKVTV